MGRKPSKNLNLPPRMRARKKPGGIYYYYDMGGKPRKEVPLGNDYVVAVKKWAELEGNITKVSAAVTLKDLADKYRKDVIPGKSDKSQRENHYQLNSIINFFGADAPIDAIKPLHVRQFMDYRKDSPSSVNREKALLSHMFNMAREWGITDMPNPCTGIKGFTEKGRSDIYTEDEVFSAVYEMACQTVKDMMDLLYLTGQRPSDVLKMSETDITNGKLKVSQNKTGKRLLIDIEGQLDIVLKRISARKADFKVRTLRLVCNEYGKPIGLNAIRKRFNEAKVLAAKKRKSLADEILTFNLQDLRAKAGTDKLEASGNIVMAQRQLGHTTVGMTEHYIRERKGDSVKPTK